MRHLGQCGSQVLPHILKLSLVGFTHCEAQGEHYHEPKRRKKSMTRRRGRLFLSLLILSMRGIFCIGGEGSYRIMY